MPNVTHRVILAGAMESYTWSMNGEHWPNVTPLMVAPGLRVAIEMVNHSMMAHPMHLHGHAYQVVAINGARLTGAVAIPSWCQRWAALPSPLMPTIPAGGRFTATNSIT